MSLVGLVTPVSCYNTRHAVNISSNREKKINTRGTTQASNQSEKQTREARKIKATRMRVVQ